MANCRKSEHSIRHSTVDLLAAGGPWLEANAGSVNEEAKRLQDLVRERLLTGFYQDNSVQFDPAAELTRVQLYNLRKAGVPALLLGSGHAAQDDVR